MLPQSAGCPPSPAIVEKMMPERSLPAGSHLWRTLPDWGWQKGSLVLSSNGLASIQGPLETATPGETESVGGEAR